MTDTIKQAPAGSPVSGAPTETADVIVVGAGPAGSATAAYLAVVFTQLAFVAHRQLFRSRRAPAPFVR